MEQKWSINIYKNLIKQLLFFYICFVTLLYYNDKKNIYTLHSKFSSTLIIEFIF